MKLSSTTRLALPLTLAPPLLMVGHYGITLPELIVAFCGMLLAAGAARVPPRMPGLVLIYVVLFTLGWAGALYSAMRWGEQFGLSSVSFLYSPALALLGFVVGRASTEDMEQVAVGRVTWIVLLAVAVLAATYAFLPVPVRQLLLGPFFDTTEMPRIYSPRFPGMGINADMYAFVVFALFLFTFDAYLDKRTSFVLPLAGAAIILACAGRTVVGLMLLSAAVMLGARLLHARRSGRARRVPRVSRGRAVGTLAVLVLLGGVAVSYGSRVRDTFALYARVQEMFGGGSDSPMQGRAELWSMGMKRVQMAPVLGIAKDPSHAEDDVNTLHFYAPHNEWIYFWSTAGLAGLLAHMLLVGGMLARNIVARAKLPWIMLYFGLAVQMMFDAAFQAPRVVAYLFMFVGMNYKYLAGLRQLRGRASPGAAAPAAPAAA